MSNIVGMEIHRIHRVQNKDKMNCSDIICYVLITRSLSKIEQLYIIYRTIFSLHGRGIWPSIAASTERYPIQFY